MGACARARARRCVRARVRVCACARARGLMAALPPARPPHAEDGSELRSHACGVAETGGRWGGTSAKRTVV